VPFRHTLSRGWARKAAVFPDDEVTETAYVPIGPPTRITWLVPALVLIAALLASLSDGCGLDTGHARPAPSADDGGEP
jgi:hypothetical protein